MWELMLLPPAQVAQRVIIGHHAKHEYVTTLLAASGIIFSYISNPPKSSGVNRSPGGGQEVFRRLFFTGTYYDHRAFGDPKPWSSPMMTPTTAGNG